MTVMFHADDCRFSSAHLPDCIFQAALESEADMHFDLYQSSRVDGNLRARNNGVRLCCLCGSGQIFQVQILRWIGVSIPHVDWD
jgi:hypothetical protein